uniref:Uncharacterized protein n=1 Tax=Parascaris univalens TaxID=6257 RepID=A0A915CJV3_PARUN
MSYASRTPPKFHYFIGRLQIIYLVHITIKYVNLWIFGFVSIF